MKRLLTVILLLLFNATTLFSQVNHYTVGSDNKVNGSVHIGDVITFSNGSKGVVFYIKPDRSGGWVVRSTDNPVTSATVQWATNTHSTDDVTGLANNGNYRTLLEDVDGYANTVAIRNFNEPSNSSYVAGNSIIDFNNGWYVPAIGQLRRLFGVLPILEGMGIPASDFTTLDRTNEYGYWSSTERNGSNAWSVKGYNTQNPHFPLDM